MLLLLFDLRTCISYNVLSVMFDWMIDYVIVISLVKFIYLEPRNRNG